MINVNLYTADPTGEHGEYRDAVYQYAENMNRMYQLFHVSFHVVEYSGKLTKDRDGKFQVKKMQNAVLPAIRTSDICQLIFLCRVTEIARPELDQLMENLTRQKKMAFQAWFINDQGLRQVFAGISGVVAQINARTAFDTEELGQMETAGSMLMRQARGLAADGKLKEAEVMLNHAVVIQQKLVLSDRETYFPGLAGPCHELGTILFRMGRMKEAESMYSQALSVRRKLLEKGHEEYAQETAGSLNNLGILKVAQGRYEEAEKDYAEAYGIYEGLLKKEPESAENDREWAVRAGMADTNANRGVMYARMKKPEDAAAAYEAALNDMRAVLSGRDDEHTKLRFATAATSLGAIRIAGREYDRAEAVLKEAEQILMPLAGEKPEEYEPRLAQVLYNLFLTSRGKQDSEMAKDYWTRSTEIANRRRETSDICRRLCDSIEAERAAAVKHQTDAAEAAEKRARQAAEAGNIQEAAKAYKEAADCYHSIPGGEYQVKSAAMYHEIAEMLWDREQLEQAEICFKNEVILTRAAAEKDEKFYPDVAMALFRLGRFCDEAKEQAENEYLTEALSIAEKYRDSSETAQEVYENLTDGAIDLEDEGEEE